MVVGRFQQIKLVVRTAPFRTLVPHGGRSGWAGTGRFARFPLVAAATLPALDRVLLFRRDEAFDRERSFRSQRGTGGAGHQRRLAAAAGNGRQWAGDNGRQGRVRLERWRVEHAGRVQDGRIGQHRGRRRWAVRFGRVLGEKYPINVGQRRQLLVQDVLVGFVQLEALPPPQQAAIFEHIERLGMEGPVRTLAGPVRPPWHLDEAIVEAKVVPERVLPALGVFAIVRKPIGNELVDITQR